MANKTATLKNQAGDNIYPNIVGDNMNTAIKDSTTIKHTLAENKISLDLDETIKEKIDAALQKPTGLTKTKLVGVGTSGQENIEIGDNLILANGKLAAAGGKSVQPTLWLFSFDSEGNPSIKTTITQEEKDNLDNGLYNQVMYYPNADGIYNTYTPSKLFNAFGENVFTQFNVTLDSASAAVKNASLYGLTIGEKDTSGNYPITIEKQLDIEVGGSGGGITPKPITSTADYASLTDTDYLISINITEDSSVAKKGTYILSGNKANGYSYWYPENKTEGTNMQIYWHYIHYDSTGLSAVGFTSYLDIGNNNKSGFGFEGGFPDVSAIFGGFSVQQIPLFSKYTLVTNAVDPVPILPCTASDNGKVLSVVNGEAQWASASSGVTVTFEN